MNMNIWGVCFGFDFVINCKVGQKTEKLENV